MAKRRRAPAVSEELNDAVEALMATPNAPLPRVNTKLAALLRIAAELRDLPGEDFKARLKAALQTSGAQPIRAAAVPSGHHSATACLVVRDAPRAIEFYRRAFGATERMRLADPDGKIVHAEFTVGDSKLMAMDAMMEGKGPKTFGGSPVALWVFVADCDTMFNRAVSAGATTIRPVADQFWGDRCGTFKDPHGYAWTIATRKEDLTRQEMETRADEFFKNFAANRGGSR